MSWGSIRDAIKTRMDAVNGLGPFFTYPRYLRENVEAAEFTDVHAESSRLNYGFVDRRAFRDRPHESDDSRELRRHEVRLEFFYALFDSATAASASGTIFQDLLEAIATDLRNGDRTLGGACQTYSLPVVEPIEPATYAGVLCHHATVSITVEEVLS